MNPTDPFSHRRPSIEPLEQRIAPALLINGANLLGGAGNPTTGQASIGGNSLTIVKVLSGEAIVWYDHGNIDAISVGPNTSLDILGNVGTIIGNLTASGKLSNSAPNVLQGLNGDVLLPNNITGITTQPLGPELGSIGEIITGGSISNLNISGNLIGAYAGNGVFKAQSAVSGGGSVTVTTGLDMNPIMAGVQNTFVFAPGNATTVASGASISNVKLGAAEELQMFAGDGFAGSVGSVGHPGTAGQAGGSITNITINNAFIDVGFSALTPSYELLAGSGGNGKTGGLGGSISSINEISSNGVVDILAGQGGTGTGGAGGVGGSIKGLNMQSDSSAYTVHAGSGGTGVPGGAGGSVTGVNFGGNTLSNGIIVAAPFTGGTSDDILLVDSLTGTMVIEKNLGNGAGFTPVIQDTHTNLTTISPDGSTPVGAVAVDIGNGLQDIVVAYKNSDSLGVYVNQGGGVFYVQNFTSGVYSGDTLQATSVSLPYAPTQIAAGNFTGDASQDLAVLLNNGGQTELMTLAGNGLGAFTVSTPLVPLPSNPVSLIPANIQGGPYSDLFVGFQSGLINSLLSSLSTTPSTAAAFTAVNSGITVAGGIANLDYNSTEGLLALNATGNALTLYDPTGAGALIATETISLTQEPGTALVAHFVSPQQTLAPIEVLTSISSGSRLDVWTLQNSNFVLTSSTVSTEALKNFVPVLEGSTSGVAAVGGSVEHFAFSQNGAPFFDVSLPFSGKKVNIVAGDGGDGINAATNIAPGGAGGAVSGMNILAGDISVQAGAGGSSINAAAGAGGLVSDTPTLVTITGQSLPTIIEADYVLTITSGTGGAAAGTAHAATGGAGGNVQGVDLSLLAGVIQVTAGDGGTGGGGAGGSGGTVSASEAVNYAGDLSVAAGHGGGAAGTIGNGGAGGSISNFTYMLTQTDQAMESPYNVGLVAGYGGASVSAIGGAGGSITGVNLTLQPSNESVNNGNASPATVHTNTDSTLRVTITAGDGGPGETGGAGGSLKTITSTSVYDQLVVVVGATASQNRTIYEVNPVVAQLTSGTGGAGSRGAGGAGGSIGGLTLAGISHYDPDAADAQAGDSPLIIVSGNGGDGTTVGGAAGAIAGVISENAQFEISSTTGTGPAGSASTTNEDLSRTELTGATIISGHGGTGGTGNGGAGGTISGLSVAVSAFGQDGALTVSGNQIVGGGELTVQTGAGGAGGTAGKGGAAGSIATSVVGSADTLEAYGVLLQAGVGGSGTLGGGAGGSVTTIQLDGPQNPLEIGTAYDSLSALILAGNGGAATGVTAVGGTGGSISSIVESKDVDSSINLIQAGNGGAAVKTGGLGGSVSLVNTVGLIGQASDDAGNIFGAFQTKADPAAFGALFPAGVPEGVFAGDGGTGTTSGLAGSVSSINAYAIAAIGAAVNSSGVFAAAAKVANITAVTIGFSAEGDSAYLGVSPGLATPTDGFIFSIAKPTAINAEVLAGSEFYL